MTLVRLKRILRCAECGERGKDHMIDVRGSSVDFYAAMERDKHQRNMILYGEEQAELMRRPGRSRHSFTVGPPPKD